MKGIKILFVLCVVSNFLLGQESNSDLIEDFILNNIDTFLLKNDIDRKELIVEFEKILTDNNFYSDEEISNGYLFFYDYQKNPFSTKRDIKFLDIQDYPNLKKFRRCNIDILSVFLNIRSLTNDYLNLDESNYLFKTLEYLDYLRVSGEIQPINFDLSILKTKGEISDFSKLFLIFVFNSYSNYDFLLKGKKTFASIFVEEAPIVEDNNSKISGNFWIKVDNKYLKYSLPYETKVNKIDKQGNKITLTSKDYIIVFLVIDENGKIQDIYSEVDVLNDQYLIAQKYFKEQIADWQPAIHKGKSVICSTRERIYFYE